MFLRTYFKIIPYMVIYLLAQRGELEMTRGVKEVIKLLKNIEEKPEDAAKILEIAKENPLELKWICKAVYHHENFDTPKKCEIMEGLVYQVILLGINNANMNVLYSTSGCMLPCEVKDSRYKEVKGEDKIVMHTNRTFTMIKAFTRLEKDNMYLFGAPESAHVDVGGQIYMRRLRERIGKLHRHAGLEVPVAFKKKKIPDRKMAIRTAKRLAA